MYICVRVDGEYHGIRPDTFREQYWAAQRRGHADCGGWYPSCVALLSKRAGKRWRSASGRNECDMRLLLGARAASRDVHISDSSRRFARSRSMRDAGHPSPAASWVDCPERASWLELYGLIWEGMWHSGMERMEGELEGGE